MSTARPHSIRWRLSIGMRCTSRAAISIRRPRSPVSWRCSESRLNGLLAAFDDVVVCTYDLAKFDAAVIIDVMRAHSAVVIGESLHQEPFHLSPEQMLHELGSKTP